MFKAYADLHGKARWGDKRPLYFQEVDVLLRLFPDAQIVHIVRDPRATVASLATMPWWPYDSVGSMATWAQADYCARRDRRRLPPDVFTMISYEALVADPEPELRRLCAFLDEDFDPAMLAAQRGAARGAGRQALAREPGLVGRQPPGRRLAGRPAAVGARAARDACWPRQLRRHGYPASGDGTAAVAVAARPVRQGRGRCGRPRCSKRWAQERRDATALDRSRSPPG